MFDSFPHNDIPAELERLRALGQPVRLAAYAEVWPRVRQSRHRDTVIVAYQLRALRAVVDALGDRLLNEVTVWDVLLFATTYRWAVPVVRGMFRDAVAAGLLSPADSPFGSEAG